MTEQRYLLLIDILGFSDLVRDQPQFVPKLYASINDLNVHRHDAFRTAVFSDTILVFSSVEPSTSDDHQYFVMYACEFAQDLMYRTIAKDVYFRAVLTYGAFDHLKLEHLDAFYGTALIDAYRKERSVQCIGLFIDEFCRQRNRFFPTARYDHSLSFVYLNSSLERLYDLLGEQLPVDRFFLEQTDDLWSIVSDVRMLERIHHHMTTQPRPKVRAKYQAAWQFFVSRYAHTLRKLEDSDFRLSTINPEVDWQRLQHLFR